MSHTIPLELPRLRIRAVVPKTTGPVMDADTYRLSRILRGSQSEVARFLHVTTSTIHRRETGKMTITHEATLALLTMPTKPHDEQPVTPKPTPRKRIQKRRK